MTHSPSQAPPFVSCGLRVRPPIGALFPGHTLVIPRRHCQGLFDLNADEYAAIWRLVRDVRETLHESPPRRLRLGAGFARGLSWWAAWHLAGTGTGGL